MLSSMRVEIQQEVVLSLGGNVNSLEVILMIPQEDKYQAITSMEVSEPYEIVTDDYGN